MRDVLYVVVAPDNDFILQHVVAFFKELSTVYEMCRLGRHCAINKPLREGVLRVGKQAAARLIDEPVEDWFNFLGNLLYQLFLCMTNQNKNVFILSVYQIANELFSFDTRRVKYSIQIEAVCTSL